MGKQVEFYILPEDESKFLDHVISYPDVKLIFSIFKEPGLHVIDDYLILKERGKYTREILIWNQLLEIEQQYFETRPQGEWNADYTEFKESGEIDYYIDKMNAPVIEYSRSGININGLLVSGRIWVNLNRVRDNHFEYKGQQLDDLYTKLARWLRNNLVRVEGYRPYFGKQALEWFKNGGQLLVH